MKHIRGQLRLRFIASAVWPLSFYRPKRQSRKQHRQALTHRRDAESIEVDIVRSN